MPDSCRCRGRSGDAITTKSQHLTPGDLLGSGPRGPVGRRTRGRRFDGPAEVRGPSSTGRRGNARRARRVEPRWAREGGPGRRNGGAAQPADRDSRKPERGYPQEDPGPAWGDPGGSAEGDRSGRDGSAGDDGGGRVSIDGCVTECGVEQGRSRSGRADDRRAGGPVADRVAAVASRPASGNVSAWRDPPVVHSQGRRRAARTRDSRRGRPGGL
jgi:hypothetical protein